MISDEASDLGPYSWVSQAKDPKAMVIIDKWLMVYFTLKDDWPGGTAMT